MGWCQCERLKSLGLEGKGWSLTLGLQSFWISLPAHSTGVSMPGAPSSPELLRDVLQCPFCAGMGTHPGLGAGRASWQHQGKEPRHGPCWGKTRALKGAESAELAWPPPALLSLNLDLTLSTISLGTSAWPKSHGKF